MRIATTWIVMAACATPIHGVAQTAKSKLSTTPHQANGSSANSIGAGAPLSLDVLSSVDPHYRGMNVAAIYASLHSQLAERKQTQYETDDQYDARRKELESHFSIGSRRIEDQYTFLLGGAWDGEGSVQDEGEEPHASKLGAIQTYYNADAQLLTVTIPALHNDAGQASFGWSYDVRTIGHHVGQNAVGVKKAITERAIFQYTLEVSSPDIDWLKGHCGQDDTGDVTCQMSVPQQKARLMDGSVTVAFGATLIDPFTETEEQTNTATIDMPFEDHEFQRKVHIAPNQLVIYSRLTGGILYQYSKEAFDRDSKEAFDRENAGFKVTQRTLSNAVAQATPSPRTGDDTRKEAFASTSTTAPQLGGQPVPVSSGVMAHNLIVATTPKYPSIAKAARIEGSVILAAIISKTGTPENIRVVSGPPMLAPAAIEAVRNWRYKPYTVDGIPVAVKTEIVVNFTIGG